MTSSIIVSVVMPVYNEEKYIEKCIDSLLLQDYPTEKMEWIFVDGCSNDKTVEILEKYQKKYPELIKIFKNPQKIVPFAMNIGIEASCGKYIVRLDAHADYATDYISKCIYYLENTDAENVGGVAQTKANGFMGNAIAKMLSSKFGVGNSQFRTNGESGYVDTVPFGAFKREVFSKYGGYDERLVRNQDNEMNFRIRKNGGKIYLSNEIHLSYYCRDSIKGISSMARKNGMWNIITMKLCPGAMGIRHFIPFAFVLSVIGLAVLGFLYSAFWLLLSAELLLYLVLDIIFSATKASNIKEFFTLLLLFPIFHVAYGIGSLSGIIKLFSKDFQKKNYINKKI
ncbi:MAG: glycosyltransferase family 2 protein [Ruminococcaceae bacterium]|nr:glycosyltransferase family 2 protein [Oscillospiraceae bacterium]